MLELIGLQEDLVERTCTRVLANREGDDLSATSVVFPSKRFGFFLRQELAEGMAGHFFPPPLYAVEPFFETLFFLNFPGWRLLNDLEAAQALHETVLAVFPKGLYGAREAAGFAAFLPWARKLLAALEEILTEGGRTQGIDWNAYGEFTRLGDYHQPYKEFIQGIPALLEGLQNRLRERRRATPGMAHHEVARLAAAGTLQVPAARHWIFSGFNAINSCERELLRFFRDRRDARFILRGDAPALDGPLSPFSLQRDTIRALGLELERGEAGGPPSWSEWAGKVTLHPCDGVESEVLQAFRILEEACRGRDEEGLRRVAVLLPAAPTLIPFIQGAVSRFDQESAPLPFNITLGYPLERTPMMQLVDSILAVLESSADGRIAAREYLQLIRHPYVKIAGGEGDAEPLKRGIHALENIINGGNLTRFTVPELEAELALALPKAASDAGREMAGEIAGRVRELHRRIVPQGINGMAPLLAFLRQALESVGSEANREAHLFLNEYAAAALAALAELEEFTVAHGQGFQAADAVALAAVVRAHFRGRAIRFVGSPLRGVQVMGPLEFRGLRFDEVIVLDALEGILPGTAKYDPILPADIRAIFQIRDHGDWEKIYALNFFSMLGAARRVHILYPRRGEDGKEAARSRFIERIAYEIEKGAGAPPRARPDPLPFAIRPRAPGRAEKGPAARERLAAMTWSPSSLEDYVRCPLQFYYKRILGLQEREEVTAESESGPIGTIVHEALQKFYEQFPTPVAAPDHRQAALDGFLEECVAAAFRRFTFDPGRGLERIRAWTVQDRLRRFILEDWERMAAGGIRVAALEKELQVRFPLPGREAPLALAGRIDRCESQGDVLRVIDYKTGSRFRLRPGNMLEDTFAPEKLTSGRENEYRQALNAFREKYQGLQLLVYLLLLAMAEGRDGGRLDGAYALLRSKEGFFKPLFPAPGGGTAAPETRRAILSSFRGDLQAVFADIFTRDLFLANPGDEAACGWCPYRLPCGNP